MAGQQSECSFSTRDRVRDRGRRPPHDDAELRLPRRRLGPADAAGVLTVYTYSASGALQTVREAAGTAEERLTTYAHDTNGNLSLVDPPLAGSGDAIAYDYRRYTQAGQLASPVVLENQVTAVSYGGGTEYFGYNAAGEPDWHRKRDGTLVTLQRDEQHRIKQINYPASGANPAFTVTANYDEFGRLSNTTDLTGTTTLAYDSLNRLTGFTPPASQHALTFQYVPDTALHRWTTIVNASGVGTYQYGEDAKGRVAQVINPYGHVYNFEFDKTGKNRLITYPTGVNEERYYTLRNARGWLDEIILRRSNGAIADQFDYYYTDANITTSVLAWRLVATHAPGHSRKPTISPKRQDCA